MRQTKIMVVLTTQEEHKSALEELLEVLPPHFTVEEVKSKSKEYWEFKRVDRSEAH